MSRSLRSRKRLGLVAAVVAAAAGIAVLVVATVGTAAPTHVSKSAAGHKCLVMTGSGDPAFVKNFNPYTATGLPSGQFIKGAVYEGLIISPEGGLPARPWLAQSWKWSNGNKTLTLNLVQNAKWSDGKPLTSADVVYSLKGGDNATQQKTMDLVGFSRPGSNFASIAAKGLYTVVINLKTVDSQFIAQTLNGAIVVPQHVWSQGREPGDVHQPAPGRLRAVQPDRPVHHPGLRLREEPALLAGRQAPHPVPRVRAGGLERLRARADPERAGRLDPQLRPERREGVRGEGPGHFHAFYATTAYPVSLVFDDTQYPYSLVAFRKALSQAIDRNTVSKLGEYGYAPPTDAIGLGGLFPQWVTDPTREGAGQGARDLQPDRGEGNAHRRRLHLQGEPADRPEGQPRQPRHPRDLGLVGLGRVEPDHHEGPAGDRHRLEREARAGLELVVPERVRDEEPDAALAERLPGLPVRLLLRELLGERVRRAGAGRHEHGQLGALPERPGHGAPPGQWKSSLDPKKQHTIATQLEKLWLQQFPIVPLFIGPRWSTYSTKYFHCYDSPKDHFGDPIFSTYPDNLLNFTHICPGGKSGQ